MIMRAPASGSIEWAPNAERTAVENVRVDHGRSHVAVPKQLLDRADVVAGVATGVTRAPQTKCRGFYSRERQARASANRDATAGRSASCTTPIAKGVRCAGRRAFGSVRACALEK